MKYQFSSKIRYSEIGLDGRLKLSALVDYLQDCAVFHSMHVGYGPEVSQAVGAGWLIVSWRIFVHEYPKLGEDVMIETWGHRFRLAEGGRNFRLVGTDGRLFAEVDSRFVYYSIKEQRPIFPTQDEKEAYGSCDALALPKTPRHVMMPEEGYRREADITVLPSHIDTNQHVNNRRYIDMALNYLPADFECREIYVDYHNQARLGDTIHPRVYEDDEKWIISLDSDEGKAYSVLQFKK